MRLAEKRHFLTLIALCFLSVNVAAKGDLEIPAGFESYLQRPDISRVEAAPMTSDSKWPALRDAHFAYVALLLGTYDKDTHLFFLARDSEYFYDIARLATDGTADQGRIHLLNVSRTNMRDQALKEYLQQNGISQREISAGKKIVLVDTGFSGTISIAIDRLFEQTPANKIKTHLILSNTADYPSTRTFFSHLIRNSNTLPNGYLNKMLEAIERMPRFSDRSNQFARSGGIVHAISPVAGYERDRDGEISKSQSLKFMADLKYFWQQPRNQADFFAQMNAATEIKNHLRAGRYEQIKHGLAAQSGGLEKELAENRLRDIINTAHAGNVAIPGAPSLKFFGLAALSTDFESQRAAHVSKTQTEELKSRAELQMIYGGASLNELRAGIKNRDNNLMSFVAAVYLINPKNPNQEELVDLMLEYALNDDVLSTLGYALSRPHLSMHKERIRRLILKAGMPAKKYFAEGPFAFDEMRVHNYQDLIELLMDTSNQDVWRKIAYIRGLSPKLLTRLIREGDYVVWVEVVRAFGGNILPTPENLEAMKLLVATGNQQILRSLLSSLANAESLAAAEDLMRRTVETIDGPLGREAVALVGDDVSPYKKVLVASLQIDDLLERKRFIKSKLDRPYRLRLSQGCDRLLRSRL